MQSRGILYLRARIEGIYEEDKAKKTKKKMAKMKKANKMKILSSDKKLSTRF